jgi:uncharacterized protein (DUF305 family)
MRTTRALAALTLGLGLVLAGCGDEQAEDSQTSSSGSDHNQADVEFATDMIQHHAQALAMVDMAVRHELDPEFADLVEAIRMAQGPEIETMSDWLVDWGEPVPATVRDHVNAEDGHMDGDHMDGDDTDGDDTDGDDMGMDMPGMMSDEDMAELDGASDAMFEDMFLTMMIEHHEGAIEMAQQEQQDGRFPDAIGLAEDIEAAQTAEIETMRAMLS